MIWLIGNEGMLGTDVETLLQERNWEYVATDKEVDITDYGILEKFLADNLKDKKVEWIINCSAYTAVDKAEDEPELAFRINALGVENIAMIAARLKTRFIHVSTDYVYDGNKETVYLESDKPNPIGVYGKSKLEGEKRIMNKMSEYFIVRTAWLYGKNGNNFVYTMLRLFEEREIVKVVSDQWGTPTYTKDLASALGRFIEINSRDYGTFHFTNEGRTNWFEFAKAIYEYGREYGLLKRNVSILPISTDEYPTKAKRPRNSHLSKEKIKKVLNLEIREWQDALRDFVIELS